LNVKKSLLLNCSSFLFSYNTQRPKIERDGPHFHITVFNSKELKAIKKGGLQLTGFEEANPVDEVFAINEDDIVDLGLGRTVAADGNTAWFIVVEVPKANNIRKMYSMPPKDFHISIPDRISGFRSTCSSRPATGFTRKSA
jgi:hypothetical protein